MTESVTESSEGTPSEGSEEDDMSEGSAQTDESWEGGQVWETGVQGKDRKERILKFINIDPSYPIPPQLPPNTHLHCLIHKLTEDILTSSSPISSSRLSNLETYCSQNKTTLIDPPSSVAHLMNRDTIQKKLTKCLGREKVPKWIVFEEGGGEEDVEEGGLEYPIICKPLDAAGTPGSHRMSIIMSPSGLVSLPPRSILQSYINHSSLLFKTYVLGSNVRVFTRKSLPDIKGGEGRLEFDSQKEYPGWKDFGMDSYEEVKEEDKPILERGVYEEIAERIREEFGVSLFGFDVVVGSGDGEVRVVDVNYFPSYKEMLGEVPGLLREFLEEKGEVAEPY
ncbi:hypothetical protein TrVE_jg932 [Triparma verrucosa]|uniref:Inositol-tetrakisphosphate 1-kinase n=1 Tax=Triparma verrucosa TaxID=1606542 RepID=A0A9W7FFW4_9STRA|nr:hypothetical protein TrVE_jg932 [Triparma verrucosa]